MNALIHNPRSPRRHSGFTLVELIVVCAIIAILFTLILPGLRGLVRSNMIAQSENTLRAVLMTARNYAISREVVAGVRIQPDGNMIVCWGEYKRRNDSGWAAIPRYRMRSAEGIPPYSLPGSCRITALDYNYGTAANNTNYDKFWTDWWLSCTVLFHPEGRVLLTECEYYNDWYPDLDADSGDFARLLADDGSSTFYSYCGGGGFWYNTQYANSGWNSTTPGPATSMALRLVDTGQISREAAPADKATLVNSSKFDSYLDLQTGMLVRARSFQKVGSNN